MSGPPLLCATDLWKSFTDEATGSIKFALRGASVNIKHGAIVALLGESGSGKSTLARCLAGHYGPDQGWIKWEGMAFDPGLSKPDRRQRSTRLSVAEHRASSPVQLVMQGAGTALNPRMRAVQIAAEPLHIAGDPKSRMLAAEMLRRVGFGGELLERRPLALSGGQRQRLALARALLARPRLLILDEAFTHLDPAARDRCLAEALPGISPAPLACLLVTHDIHWAEQCATEIAVMEHGRVVEFGDVKTVLRQPVHAQTRRLLQAAAEG